MTRFNWRLAQRLTIPIVALGALKHSTLTYPLVSVHWADVPARSLTPLMEWNDEGCPFDLWLHDEMCPDALLGSAGRVWVSNAAIAREVTNRRPDRRLVWCPSTITPHTRVWKPGSELSLLTFGMAHKLQIRSYWTLRHVLGNRPYRLEVSTAIHEGIPWAEALGNVESRLRAIFGTRLCFWGALSDWGLANRLSEATALVTLFPTGMRANHTSVWAGLSAGIPVITRLDADSPPECRHGETVWNLDVLTAWPDADALAAVGLAGQQVAQAYSWDRLLEVLRCDR